MGEFIKPFIRWAGGKQNLVGHLLKNTPPENVINKYWEPFLEAGSLFFANGFRNAEISDVNPQLINSYKQIRSNPFDVSDRLNSYKANTSREFYYTVRSEFNANLHKEDLEQAVRFIFLVHTSFNGMYRVNQKGHYNVPFGKEKPSIPTLTHLNKVKEKLENVEIRIASYDSILNKVTKGDFIYLDPPYPKLDEKEQFQQFTSEKFAKRNQIELSTFANELRRKGCFVLISNSKLDYIEKIFSDWNMLEIQTTRYVNCKKDRIKINELLIKNY